MIVVSAQRSSWTSGIMSCRVDLPCRATAWPQTRKSTPAFFKRLDHRGVRVVLSLVPRLVDVVAS